MVGIQKLWYRLSTQDLLDFFVTDIKNGISESESIKRADKFGYNPAKCFTKGSAKFYSYKTLRSSKWVSISADNLVLGDIIALNKGDVVPANSRLIKVSDFKVNEERLTGNFVPTPKNSLICKGICPKHKQHNMIFAGSVVVSGSALVLLVDYNVPKINQKKSVKISKNLKINNFTANKNVAKSLKNIDTVVFDDLKQDYEVIKTVQQIFIAKNITCIYFLDKKIINKCKTSLPDARIITPQKDIYAINKEVVFVSNPSQVDKTKVVSRLKAKGNKMMYVYRGEQFVDASKAADITLVVNKNSSQESIFYADLITGRVNLNNLSSILYNKK